MKNEIQPKDSSHGPEQNFQILLANYFSQWRYLDLYFFYFCSKTIEFQREVRVRYENLSFQIVILASEH